MEEFEDSERFARGTVLLVESFEPFRKLVRFRLKIRPELDIVGEVSNGEDALLAAETLHPDLIIMDINLSTLNGFAAARAIMHVAPRSEIVFLTQETAPEFVYEAFVIGAKGYVAKIDVPELTRATDAVLNGERYLSRTVRETIE